MLKNVLQFYIILKDMAKLSIIGLDESGRGPLAGPVVAVAVRVKSFESELRNKKIGICDSKKLTPKKREKIYELIARHPDVEWGMGVISKNIIDKINILEATKLAMKEAVSGIDYAGSLLIIDGNFKINLECNQKPVLRADESVLECSMASILAKVERDKMMDRYHKIYPCYGFQKHKGYGTKMHREMIKKHKPCPIHRKSFRLL